MFQQLNDKDKQSLAAAKAKVNEQHTPKENYDRVWRVGKVRGFNECIELIEEKAKNNKEAAQLLKFLPSKVVKDQERKKKKAAKLQAQLDKLQAEIRSTKQN